MCLKRQTLAKETRALGSNSRWYVASFAIAVTTKHKSLACDDFLKGAPSELLVGSWLKPKRLSKTQKHLHKNQFAEAQFWSLQSYCNTDLDKRFSYKSNSKLSKSSRATSLCDIPPPPCSPIAQHNCNANSVYWIKKKNTKVIYKKSSEKPF